MPKLALLVEFVVKPGFLPEFRRLIRENARKSLTDEPRCRRFDVLLPEDDAERVVLYEIYDDAAAFAHHLTTPHYKSFAAAIDGRVETPSVRRLMPLAAERGGTRKPV